MFILGLFAGNATVGIYAAVEKVARAGASLFQPLTKALFPALAGRFIRGTPDAVARCRSWTRRIVLLAASAGLAMYALAPLGLELLFGDGWAAHAHLLQLLAVWLTASVAATVLGQFWLLARDRQSAYAACLLKAALLQVLTACIAAGLYGSRGLVVAAIIAEISRLAFFYAAVRRNGNGAIRCAS